MKKITTIIELTLIAILSVAIVFIFFPQLHAPDWISSLYWSALTLLIIGIILNMIEKPTEQEMRTFSFYYGVYLLVLITLLPLIGGRIPTSNILFLPSGSFSSSVYTEILRRCVKNNNNT